MARTAAPTSSARTVSKPCTGASASERGAAGSRSASANGTPTGGRLRAFYGPRPAPPGGPRATASVARDGTGLARASVISFRRGALHLPVRPGWDAHRFDRADPALLPPYPAHPPRSGAVGRRLDDGTRHAAVGAVPAVHRRSDGDRRDGLDLPRLH